MLPWNQVLVLAPHADDETLGCGGLLARSSREGSKATVVLFTGKGPQRLAELDRACAALGGIDLHVFRSSLNDSRPAIDELNNILDQIEPDVVLVPFAGAHHQDHRAVSAIALSAARPLVEEVRFRPRCVLAYEHAADQWTTGDAFQARLFVRLASEDIDAKVAAMACHESQRGDPYGIRSDRAIRSLAELRGAQVGVAWAEAFMPLLEVF